MEKSIKENLGDILSEESIVGETKNKKFKIALAIPESGSKIQVHTIETATVGVIHGEKRMNLRIPLPLSASSYS